MPHNTIPRAWISGYAYATQYHPNENIWEKAPHNTIPRKILEKARRDYATQYHPQENTWGKKARICHIIPSQENTWEN